MFVRDGDGHVVPHNDDGLADDDVLIRRVTGIHIQPDGAGGRRISKSAMSGSSKDRDSYQGMSVDLERILLEMGIDPSRPDQYHPDAEVLLGLRVGDIREQCPELLVGRCPIEVPKNPAHCCVWGISKDAVRKKLLALSRLVRAPNGLRA